MCVPLPREAAVARRLCKPAMRAFERQGGSCRSLPLASGDEWVGDNVEVVVATVIGLIDVGVAIGIALWQSKPKRLDYRVKTKRADPQQARKRAREPDRGFPLWERLKEPRLGTVRIMNTGKQGHRG